MTVTVKVEKAPSVKVNLASPSVTVRPNGADSVTVQAGTTGPAGPPGPPGVSGAWVSMTQAEYDAIPMKDPNTLYVIVG